MAQQTAVSQLIELLRQFAHNPKTHLGMGDIRVTLGYLDELEQELNQVFEEQIEKAWWAGHDERDSNHMIYPSEDCNQYYNQTFGETNNL